MPPLNRLICPAALSEAVRRPSPLTTRTIATIVPTLQSSDLGACWGPAQTDWVHVCVSSSCDWSQWSKWPSGLQRG